VYVSILWACDWRGIGLASAKALAGVRVKAKIVIAEI